MLSSAPKQHRSPGQNSPAARAVANSACGPAQKSQKNFGNNKEHVSAAQNFSSHHFDQVNVHTPITIQPKLFVNQPNDAYEQEADAVADKVMRMKDTEILQTKSSPTGIQRKCAHCDEEGKQVQRKTGSGAMGEMTAPAVVHHVINSGGHALDAGTRGFMEARFGYDFSKVQVHNDTQAHQSSAAINALAYTHGNHVVFGAEQFQPQTNSGRQLLAHELAHVVQQDKGRMGQLLQRQDHFKYVEPVPKKNIDPIAVKYSQDTGSHAQDKISLGLTTPTVNNNKTFTVGSLKTLFDLRSAADPVAVPAPVPKPDKAPDPKADPKTVPKQDAGSGAKVDPKPAPKQDTTPDPKPPVKQDTTPDPKPVPVQDPDIISCHTSSIATIEISAEELILKASGSDKKWKGTFNDYPGDACSQKTNIPVTISGDPDGPAIENRVLANENEHVKDIKLACETLNADVNAILAAHGRGRGADGCIGDLLHNIGKGDDPAGTVFTKFINKLKSDIRARDDSGSHTFKSTRTIGDDCANLRFTYKA